MSKKYYKYEETHQTFNGVKHKRCSKCKKWKDKTKFGKRSTYRDGLSSWCKDCCRERAREHYKKAGKGSKQYRRYEEYHRVVDGVEQKRCRKCKKWKAESEFYKKRQNKDGLAIWCKECANKATNKARRKRLAVKEN